MFYLVEFKFDKYVFLNDRFVKGYVFFRKCEDAGQALDSGVDHVKKHIEYEDDLYNHAKITVIPISNDDVVVTKYLNRIKYSLKRGVVNKYI